MNRMTFTATALVLATLAISPGNARAGASGNDGARPAAVSDSAGSSAPRPAPPLLLDPADLGFGATVVFSRLPSAAEIHDLEYLESVRHVIFNLPAWPADLGALRPLADAFPPEGADFIVVLPGYPGTHAQAEAWNRLGRPVRLIMVVNGPPVDRDMIFAMNAMRGLERVVVDMARPSRAGFERLQRPLAFRVVMP